MNYKEDLEPEQKHYKTEMIQQEHHKAEYHLCEVIAEISFCKLNIYQPFYFFSTEILYKSNLIYPVNCV